jgi:Domain of unknown function (DUF4276)
VEGQTEETFVNHVLAPDLGAKRVFITAHRVTTGRKRNHLHRGGISHYAQLKNDLVLWMKQDRGSDARFTTMVDLYRLPDDFPGNDECRRRGDPFLRVRCLEENLQGDINDYRFVPYIQLHEFEALLFSDVSAIGNVFPDQPELADLLARVADAFQSPEHINENPDQSPSARLLQLIPGYVKPVMGLLIAQRIGLETLRSKCAHFRQWMNALEKLDPV